MAMENRELTGKNALVTGGAKRLGRAIVLALAAEGARVVIHYRQSAEAAAQTAEEARAAGPNAWTLQADLGLVKEAEALFPRAVAEAGPIDILVNNASIFEPDRLLEVAPEEIARNTRIHAVAPLLLSRAMAAQGRVGHIVNLLDTRITAYDRDHAAYHLSKRMLFTLTRMLALELAPHIAVNAVAPGLVLPPPGKDESYLAAMAPEVPMARHGSAADVADAALYLLKSRFTTGQILYVDGGGHMKGRVYG